MKVFHCERCEQVLFFENSQCVSCGTAQAFVPDVSQMLALPEEPGGHRLCHNYTEYQTCNWAIAEGDDHQYCVSCRLTRVIPDVTQPAGHVAWYRLEIAKRRLVFTLMALGLPLLSRDDDPEAGLAFEFKSDPDDPAAPRVLTGHASGVITINVAEADDAEREKRRTNLNEPYRTLLGHMRHESGHYYWDRLVRDSADIEEYRAIFGDERPDYGAALANHYQAGAPADWQNRFISAYASSHSWEDWAETWAHYLHMVDALETAADNGLSLKPRRADEPVLPRLPAMVLSGVPFDRLIESWVSLTYVLNNLNRGMGLPDGYPFVLSTPAIDKLRFVHDVVTRASQAQAQTPKPTPAVVK